MKKVMIGMSGGVDSTAATIILMKDGYEVAGATMILTDSMFVASSEAKAICDKLGIKHYEFDMREAFQTRVREYFARSYYEGFTPNPCVVCNREFKFGDFLKKAIEPGYDYIATGHYCNLRNDEKGVHLLCGNDKKDQSYFLCNVKKESLEHVVFPINAYEKSEVRSLVGSVLGLEKESKKKDSQDICFVKDYMDELKRYTANEAEKEALTYRDWCKEQEVGDFVLEGNAIGKHQGYVKYTVGQRHGMGLSYSEPLYVLGTQPESNQVVVGTSDKLFARGLQFERINVINDDAFAQAIETKQLTGKVRFGKKKYKIESIEKQVQKQEQELELVPGEYWQVFFEEEIRAITPGQYIALYYGDECVGGGRITNTVKEDLS